MTKYRKEACVNRAVRCMAGLAHLPIGKVWKELYAELRYKHGMGLSQRGPAPFIQHVREDEWAKVQQTVVAMCYNYGLAAEPVIEAAKIK